MSNQSRDGTGKPLAPPVKPFGMAFRPPPRRHNMTIMGVGTESEVQAVLAAPPDAALAEPPAAAAAAPPAAAPPAAAPAAAAPAAAAAPPAAAPPAAPPVAASAAAALAETVGLASLPTASAPASIAFDRTHAAPTLAASDVAKTLDARTLDAETLAAQTIGAVPHTSAAGRTTLGVLSALPRVRLDSGKPELLPHDKPRFEQLRILGSGGMGEVALVRDEDIDRTVAVKRLHAELSDPIAIARFIDEVRTVGRLEHPNIVPLHDVGLDAAGRFYFVMKYVEGETLEQIIERLAAGDPAAQATYTFEVRAQIFLSLLRALEYAHALGIIHRDIKPANVMVGRFGELLLMDWGIAKQVGAAALDLAAAQAPGRPDQPGSGARTFQTANGVLLGTPAYMSPEQARGENATLDARSDLYSATALFYELMTTHHYLGEPAPTTIDELLHAVKERPFKGRMRDLPLHRGAHQGTPPAEYIHFARRGLEKAPAARFQSATEMIARLQHVADGRVPVECPITFTKRVTREASRFVDRHPVIAMWSFLVVCVLVLGSLATTLSLALG